MCIVKIVMRQSVVDVVAVECTLLGRTTASFIGSSTSNGCLWMIMRKKRLQALTLLMGLFCAPLKLYDASTVCDACYKDSNRVRRIFSCQEVEPHPRLLARS